MVGDYVDNVKCDDSLQNLLSKTINCCLFLTTPNEKLSSHLQEIATFRR